jgi:protocatechuate 3,4-dioxygenase beta subunit
VSVSAQQATSATPSRDTRPDPKSGTGAIRGRVTGADAIPLRRVQLRLTPLSASVQEPRSTITTDEGRYEFKDLPAGRYELEASKGGYLAVEYGQRRPFEKGRPIELADKQILDRVDLTLPQGAVVVGRVVDEAGEPVAGAGVQLARYRYSSGQRRLSGAFGDSTDDRGEFRIFGVPPAEYYLYADFGRPDFRTADRVRYVRTFFPGTASVTDAQRIRVKLGEELSGLTVALRRERTASISGVVRSSTPTPFPFSMVNAIHIDDDSSDFGTGLAGADGAFSIDGVLPGTYVVEARTAVGGESASARVTVSGSDVAGVVLTMSNGVTARGQIRFDGGTPPRDLRPSQVFLFGAEDGNSIDLNGELRSPVRDDWSFEIRGLRGRRLVTGGTASGWHVKTVSLNSRDVTDVPIDFTNGDVNGIDVLLTNRSTEVSGRVTDDRGATAGDASVIIFAADSDKWTARTRFISAARPDQQGRFTISGLPAARYLAIAVDYLEEGEEHDPELLTQWASRATSFTLGDGETRAVDLRVIASN